MTYLYGRDPAVVGRQREGQVSRLSPGLLRRNVMIVGLLAGYGPGPGRGGGCVWTVVSFERYSSNRNAPETLSSQCAWMKQPGKVKKKISVLGIIILIAADVKIYYNQDNFQPLI